MQDENDKIIPDLARVIYELIYTYDAACKDPYINRPIEFALFHTWKEEDKRYNKEKKEKKDVD